MANGAADVEGVDSPQRSEAENRDLELPAPQGWKKKLTPKKGSAGGRNEIVFISPTGEEIRSKRQLEQYLKSHPGGPPPSEFDWGTGETPRRSSRISEKGKATETPEGQPAQKREKKLSSEEEAKEEIDGDGVTEAPAAADEPKSFADAEMKENEVEGVAANVAGANEGYVEHKEQEELKKNDQSPLISKSNSHAEEAKDENLEVQPKEKADSGLPLESIVPPQVEAEGTEGLQEKNV
ncbi:hypothetical protein AAC387_Pa05g3103 [Persea americana]